MPNPLLGGPALVVTMGPTVAKKNANLRPRNSSPEKAQQLFLLPKGEHPRASLGHMRDTSSHASVSCPACEKYRPTLPMSANTVNSYVAAQSYNVSLISSLSGTDREEILVNIQIWLGSDPISACCGRPPERDKRHAVLQCISICVCV